MPHALIVEDDESFRLGLVELVRGEGFTVATAGSLAEARAELDAARPDIVLIDLHLPDGTGLELLAAIEDPGAVETILITGQASVNTAVEALRRGAADYLTKPIDIPRLKMTLGNVTRSRALKRQLGELRGELRKLGRFGHIIGGSAPMQAVYDQIARVASTDATVLITGETGTGKEIVAVTIHELSARGRNALVPVNCGAVSPSLIESELFGHERGSFTGAERAHKGVFERASGGTLFLDEVTEMSGDLQVKLLRVLETSSVMRVGGNELLQVDVRVIAATNRVPDEAVAAGKLRQDLLFRLNVFPIHLPPLREREGDVELLAQYFLDQLNEKEGASKRFTSHALERLRTHNWPGNVRELRNVVQRAFILAEKHIGAEELPLAARPGSAPVRGGSIVIAPGSRLEDVQRLAILVTLEHFGRDKKRAAEALGISLKTLYSRLSEYRARAPARGPEVPTAPPRVPEPPQR